MTSELYPYASGDLLAKRNVYSYSPYHGEAFLDAWKQSRKTAGQGSAVGRALSNEHTPTFALIQSVALKLKKDPIDTSTWQTLDRLLQRFEVTKRVHHEYTSSWRSVDKTAFSAMPAYVELAETLLWAYQTNGSLTYLNVLLKLLDTLSSLLGDLPEALQRRTSSLIQIEAALIDDLIKSVARRERPGLCLESGGNYSMASPSGLLFGFVMLRGQGFR